MPHVRIFRREVRCLFDSSSLVIMLTLQYSALCVLDPSHLEAQLASGTITLTLNSQQEICVLTKAGGTPLAVNDIMKVVLIGVGRVKELDATLKAALEKEARVRIVEVR